MPASFLSTDMNGNSGGLEDHRAMQLALELTMLAGLHTDEDTTTTTSSSNGLPNAPQTFDESAPRKRSANMTECVPVPSSEHVAEIVGRQGCKIKALRAKTNTYIKTPVRGEEPVFVVTGRKEDVAAAKREILSAADHFSQIRASRRNNSASGVSGTNSNLTPGPPSPNTPGHVTIQVRVPYRVVGLVVGPKGATIKRIQQQTHTYIITPSRDKEPVFDVTGLPENVEKARQEIESHIAMRTGGLIEAHQQQDENDFHTNGVDSGFHELGTDIGPVYPKTANSAAFTYPSSGLNGTLLSRRSQEPTIFNFPPVTSTTSKLTDTYNPLSNGFNAFNSFSMYDNDEGISSPSFDPVPSPAGLWPELSDPAPPNRGSSLVVSVFTSTGSNPTSTNTTSCSSVTAGRRSSLGGTNTTPRLSPTLESAEAMANGTTVTGSLNTTTLGGSSSSLDHHPILRRIRSDPLTGSLAGISSFGPLPTCTNNYATTSSSTVTSITSSCPESPPPGGGGVGSRPRRNCLVCSESEVVAALVPCGHNLFCMECANLIVEKPIVERLCPVCEQTPTQAIRIFS
ncbi:RNA-binding protein MEX3B-like [Octopus vulgaris]|uniref:RNA-binding protein MEX3B-like n=2 Tax=Octopus TaxID=6643 RepID=A0AA36FDJ6_OCTVU|nr:RNA-binding protein MEX3B [Octopus sinensis]CAI9733642.1 RNA-binding protein MEX3B-like [Octopus vulgaris]